MSENNVLLGVPIDSRTPDGLNVLFVNVLHQWLCDNTLTFQDFTVEALNAIRNFYTRPDVGSVTGVKFGYNTPNAANSSTINDPLSNILPPLYLYAYTCMYPCYLRLIYIKHYCRFCFV